MGLYLSTQMQNPLRVLNIAKRRAEPSRATKLDLNFFGIYNLTYAGRALDGCKRPCQRRGRERGLGTARRQRQQQQQQRLRIYVNVNTFWYRCEAPFSKHFTCLFFYILTCVCVLWPEPVAGSWLWSRTAAETATATATETESRPCRLKR